MYDRLQWIGVLVVMGLLCPGRESGAASSSLPILQTNLVSPWINVAPAQPLGPGSNTTTPSANPVASSPPASLLWLTNAEPAHPVPMTSAAFWPLQRLRGSHVPVRDFVEHFGGGELRRITAGPDPAYDLLSGRGKLGIQVSSTRASLCGVQVALSQVPQIQGGDLWLSRFDLQHTVHPILWSAQPTGVTQNGRIMLDPGHGGRDVGTTSVEGRQHEKNLTLDWALRLKAILEGQGWTVLMTRTNDSDVSLAQRVFLAEAAAADLFISLHFNSAPPNSQRRGLETYALTPAGMLSTVVRDSEDNPKLRFPNNQHDLANFLLAYEIQKSTVALANAPDRGVQRARFMGVLRGQNRPAVLVEGGYLSHPEESRRIVDPLFRQKLAEGVAKALESWRRPSS